MSIIDNLKRVAAVVAVNDLTDGSFGEMVKNAAINAMTNGLTSLDGEKYMSLFADNAEQLARLTTATVGTSIWLPQARAYIMANAVCGTITGTRTHVNVNIEIDNGLSTAPDTDDATRKKRPFPIPTPVFPPAP